jgi:hypothetical protein
MYPNASTAGFRQDVLKSRERRQKRRKFTRVSLFAVLIILVLGLFANYLANLPRERHARNYSYLEKVKLGAQQAFSVAFLSLSADAPDPKRSELPLAEIYIRGKRLDKLTEDLPASGSEYQKASVKIDGEEFDAVVRLRGDSMNHWAFPQKSWRVSLSKGKFLSGTQVFNLNVPRVETQLSNWLGYQMAATRPDLIVQDARNYHFRLNRQFAGVRLYLEQPNQEFLQRRNLVPGKIFVGDIDTMQIYGGVKRKRIYLDPSAWEVRSPSEDVSNGEVIDLIRILKTEHNPFARFRRLRRVVDIESLTQYIALLEQVGSVHVDETHNGKYYFNPVSGKFVPIVWDTVAYFWKNRFDIDLGPNSLFRSVLEIPEWREMKDRKLWQAIQGKLSTENVLRMIDEEAGRMRRDLRAFPLKLHANDKGIRHLSNPEWEQAVSDLRVVVAERNKKIVDLLSQTDAAYRLVGADGGDGKQLLGVEVRSRSGVRLDQVVFDVEGAPDGSVVSVRRRGLSDIGVPVDLEKETVEVPVKGGKAKFFAGDRLYSRRAHQKRRGLVVLPSTYVYELSAPKGARVKGVTIPDAYNAVTGAHCEVPEESALEIAAKHIPKTVWWSPDTFARRVVKELDGSRVLESDMILNEYTSIRIPAGTHLKLGPQTSIIARGGSIDIEGTVEDPVVIEAADPGQPWGVIAALGGPGITISHAKIRGGSEDRAKSIRFDGAISAFHTTVKASNSTFVDNYLSVQEGGVSLEDVEFSNIYPFNVLARNASVREEGVKKTGYEPVLRAIEGPAFGTPARAEREFKYSLIGQNGHERDLGELAEDILSSLKEAVQDRSLWKAEKFTHTQYYADSEWKDFMFRDVYFDTPDSLSYKHRISYRLRNRYKSYKGYRRHVKNPAWTAEWPYRAEFQAKYGRKELGNGFSTVDEARFELRKESKPFSDSFLPPPPPWDLDEYIPHFQAGHYKGIHTLPAKDLWGFLRKKGVQVEELAFEPRLVLLTERFRQHLNIKSPWGSGPNPGNGSASTSI